MKKSLIAIAALATVATAAQAQSSVTVYGVLDAGYSDISRDATTAAGVSEKQKQQAFSFNNYTSSRLGVRGSEDIGGGLRANFVIETGIGSNVMAGYSQSALNYNSIARQDRGNGAANNGTTIDATSLGNRELNASIVNAKTGTTVGLGFGSTAIRNTWVAFDPAGGTNLVGNLLTNDAVFSSNRATGLGISQKAGDFTLGAAISRNNGDTTSSATSTQTLGPTKTSTGYTLSAGYAKGPMAFAAARQETKTVSNAAAGAQTIQTSDSAAGCTTGGTGAVFTSLGSTTGSTPVALYSCNGANTLATDVKRTVNILAGSYDAGFAKFFVNYGSVKTEDAATVNALGEGKRSAYVVGATVPVGKVTLFGLYSDGKQEQVTTGAATATYKNGANAAVTTTTAGEAPVKRDITGYTVGARYALSKRTFGYAAVGETKLDASSQGGSYNYGVKVQQATVGLAHSF